MGQLLGRLNAIFDRRTKRRMVVATAVSMLIATLDTAAIALVLPLVDLATGTGTDSGAVRWVVDVVGVEDDRTLLAVLTVTVVSLFILKDLGSMAFTWWTSGFMAFERVRTSARLLRHFVSSPYTSISRRSTPELLRTMNESVAWLFANTVSGLMHAVSSAVAIGAIVIALMVIAPLPTLVVVAYFGLAGVLYARVIKPRAIEAGIAMTDASLVSWRTALAALGGIKELTIRGSQEHFVERYSDAAMRAARAGRVAGFLNGLPRYILEILFILAVGLMLVVSMATTARGAAGSVVGLLAVFVAAGFRILPSVSGLLGSMSGIKVGNRALELVHAEVVEARDLARVQSEEGPRLSFREMLRVEDVSFRYPERDVDVLSGVSLEIPRGSSVALVGGSGAGKTTLVDIILGLHEPRAGTVTVDGVPITGRTRRWQLNLGHVPQDVYLLDATLAENIAFDQDRADIDETLLLEAVRKAQLKDVVAGLPLGLETPVGEKGSRLSGGQRQRVGIARALYRRPELLVLDEATSALDNETEHRVGQTLRELRGEITVVVVAHRLSTVRHSDQIVFMKEGRVVASGSFDEVRERDADFAHLVQLGSLAALDPAAPRSGPANGPGSQPQG